MDNPATTAPLIPSHEPFTKWADCLKAIKKLPPALSDTDKELFVTRIKASKRSQNIAFELLWWLQGAKSAPKLQWIEAPMLALLGAGDVDPKLVWKSPPSDAGKWVRSEMREVQTLADWNTFVASGRHYWLLHVILRTVANKHVLVEALAALALCIENCQVSKLPGKPAKKSLRASSAGWIAKLIKSRIPPKSKLPKAFHESLFAIIAAAELSESLRQETNDLQHKLNITQTALAEAKQARIDVERRADTLQTDLNDTVQSLEITRQELAEEKLHTTRQGGFNTVAKRETINHVLSTVRQGINHRLENIRGYADRQSPDRGEIMVLVSEIEKHLSGIEEELGK